MPLNPLDWPAGPFLTLYVCLAVIAFVAVRASRSRIGPTAAPRAATSDPLELAWLTGGRRRAADTVLVAFLEDGAGELSGVRRRSAQHGSFRRFAALTDGIRSPASFRRAIQPGLDESRDALARRGLAPSPEQIARLTGRTWTIFAIPLVLGAMKCAVGAERGRPIGFLVLLLIVTAGVALWLTVNPPFRTRAGRDVAADARRLQARAARAPRDNEMVMAFALSGAAVLAGRPYAHMFQTTGGGGSGCGGGGGDSGGGGSGCGGCSGGGC